MTTSFRTWFVMTYLLGVAVGIVGLLCLCVPGVGFRPLWGAAAAAVFAEVLLLARLGAFEHALCFLTSVWHRLRSDGDE